METDKWYSQVVRTEHFVQSEDVLAVVYVKKIY